MNAERVPPEALAVEIAADELAFETTEQLPCLEGFLGHTRASEAIEFALSMPGAGYNLFVLGEPGTGRSSLLRQLLERKARSGPAPSDWLYLPRFDRPREPIPLELSAGSGPRLIADIEALVDGLMVSVWSAFENPAYLRRRSEIERRFQDRYVAALDRVGGRARDLDIAMFRNGEAVSFAPVRNGAPVDESGFGDLSQLERDQFYKSVRKLEDVLGEALLELPQWRRDSEEALRVLAVEWVEQAAAPLFQRISVIYEGVPGAPDYLESVRTDFGIAMVPLILEQQRPAAAVETERRAHFRQRYLPWLVVSRGSDAGTPVVFEADPTLDALFGRIEYIAEPSSGPPGVHGIYAGSLHRANGGYLVLDADKVLADADVWNALKRAIKGGTLRFETSLPEPGGPATPTLSPGAIPLRIKIALIGSSELYYALRELDPEFPALFRVLAELDRYFPRDSDTTRAYCCLLKTLAGRESLAPLAADATAALLTRSVRLAEHRHRLSARVGSVIELVSEADFFRQRAGDTVIGRTHVEQAAAAQQIRIGRVREELLEQIVDGTVLIASDGQAPGRVNALTLLEIGDSRIGMPARITATVHVGHRGIVDIEREVELGQAIHSKGVMILAGYLGHQFARRFPLAISAHLALEQSYGYVDGDSAALAELCALLSALTGVPLSQSYAVTGSMNQYGEVQAVGGVNEKIEGFFELCRARGLTGRQGVLIPQANLRNLVLAEPVVAAVRERAFAVHAVRSVDEALTILTGQPAGLLRDLASSALERFSVIAKSRER
jgi:predicted ATP-dependent protease